MLLTRGGEYVFFRAFHWMNIRLVQVESTKKVFFTQN